MYGNHTPSRAERLRSMVTAASSLVLHTPGHRADLAGRHSVDESGRLILELPAASCLNRHLLRSGEVVATVEFTDIAPTPTRQRVRSRAVLTGWLSPADDTDQRPTEQLAALDLATAELTDPSGTTEVDPDAFRLAVADPLATVEAELLCHLVDHHPDAVAHLRSLVPPQQLRGVQHVHPVRLDRFGVVLRLEFAGRDRDVRLPFSAPLDTPDQAAEGIDQLLTRAGH